jgi:hypothetical protein
MGSWLQQIIVNRGGYLTISMFSTWRWESLWLFMFKWFQLYFLFWRQTNIRRFWITIDFWRTSNHSNPSTDRFKTMDVQHLKAYSRASLNSCNIAFVWIAWSCGFCRFKASNSEWRIGRADITQLPTDLLLYNTPFLFLFLTLFVGYHSQRFLDATTLGCVGLTIIKDYEKESHGFTSQHSVKKCSGPGHIHVHLLCPFMINRPENTHPIWY